MTYIDNWSYEPDMDTDFVDTVAQVRSAQYGEDPEVEAEREYKQTCYTCDTITFTKAETFSTMLDAWERTASLPS